jgi:hypothetical protein
MDYPNYPVNIVSPSFIRTDMAHALLLLAINRDLSAVHVQHYPSRRIDGFGPADQLPIERGHTGEVVCLRQQFRLE